MKIMRYVYGLLLSLPFVVSCSETEGILETNDVPYWKRDLVIEATREGHESETRTIRQEDGAVYWNPADEISLFFMRGENGGYKFTSQNTEVTETAEFAGSISGITGGGENLTDDAYFWAIYPYSKENACENNSLITRISEEQQGLAETFADDTFVTVARSMNVKMGFYNVCGGLRFTVSQSGIKSVSFRGNNDEVLAGKVRVEFNESNIPVVTEILDGQKEITLVAPNGGEFEVGKLYYLVALPKALEGGFTMTFRKTDGTVGVYTRTTGVTLKRSIFGTVRNLDAGLTFEREEGSGPIAPDGLVTIHNAEKGMLLVELMEYDYAAIESMKVTGTMNDEDFLWIYYEMPALRYLDISETNVTTLPNRSFYQSTNVETIIMPATLQTIPNEVFYESVVKEVYLNEGLQTIGDSAFENCDNLTSIHFPQSLTTMGKRAFYDCNNLSGITFESGCMLSAIQSQTFYNTPVVEIQIPAGVESITGGVLDVAAFSNCKNLKTVTFEENSKFKTLESYSFGKSIENDVFETIEIPNSVEIIAARAIENTRTLKNVYFEQNSSLKSIGTYAFSGSGLQTIQIPASTQKIYHGAFYGNTLESVIFEQNSKLTDLGIGIDQFAENSTGVFEGCTKLTSIIIPSSVHTIYARAFANCTALSHVGFADNSQLEIIGGGWYSYYSAYSGDVNVTINGSFRGCTSLTSITIPRSVKTIEVGAFYASGLTAVAFEENSQLEEIQGYVYYITSNSTGEISYFEDTGGSARQEPISGGAFAKTQLTSITLPASLKMIGDGAFAACKTLKKVAFEDGASLESIGVKAFKDCDLTTIKLPSKLQTIEERAFENNQNLKIINFEEDSQLAYIRNRAFANCGTINYFYAQSVSKLAKLGSRVFEGCDEMRLFKLGTVVCPVAYSDSFGEIGTYSVLKVPTESVSAYKAATGWKLFSSITGLDE